MTDKNILAYILEIDHQYRTGLAREHSYRPALQQLLAALLPQLTVTNEPARIACGAPDFIITRKSDALALAFLEAKDIDDQWLKDRKGRILTFADICHYKQIIFALTETQRIMQEIDAEK